MLILLNSCQKEKNEPINSTALSANIQKLDLKSQKLASLQATALEDDLGKNIAFMIQSIPSLKLIIEANYLKQERGDYGMMMENLLITAKVPRQLT